MRFSFVGMAAALALSFVAASAAKADFIVTFENAGVLNTTTSFNYSGVETFDSRTNGGFTTDFGTGSSPIHISGTYNSNTLIKDADIVGGAGGIGKYAATFNSTGYTLDLSAVDSTNGNTPVPITYFGFWLSALDAGNNVIFYRGGNPVFSFTPTDVISQVGNCPNVSNPFCGNPSGTFQGHKLDEPFVFLNFYDNSGLGFDKIVYLESITGAGYESDNHTVGYFLNQTGNPSPAPEPETVSLFGIGLAALGFVRRRKLA